jgi:predicted ester cyclase
VNGKILKVWSQLKSLKVSRSRPCSEDERIVKVRSVIDCTIYSS